MQLSSQEKTIGLVGVGNIGSHLVRKIRGADKVPVVFDINSDKMKTAENQGAFPAGSPREVAEQATVVLLSLPSADAVVDVVAGERGILPALVSGHIVADLSTTLISTTLELAKMVTQTGAHFLDCPVTWRKPELTMMAGGTPEAFAAFEPTLRIIAGNYAHVGPVSHGQYAKIINQLQSAGQMAGLAEALHLCRRAGLNCDKACDLLGFPAGKAFLQRRFEGGSALALFTKDLRYIEQTAQDLGVQAPLNALVRSIFEESLEHAEPDWTPIAIITYWERLNGQDE